MTHTIRLGTLASPPGRGDSLKKYPTRKTLSTRYTEDNGQFSGVTEFRADGQGGETGEEQCNPEVQSKSLCPSRIYD